MNKDGSLKELNQKMTVGQGLNRVEVRAKYGDGRTEINAKAPGSDTKTTRPGPALLRMATDRGALKVEY